MEDVKKLPKWAQNRIEILEGKVVHLEKRVRDVFNNPNSPVRFKCVGDVRGEFQGFPEDVSLYFRVGKGDINVHVEGDRLMLHEATGSCIAVCPQAANAVAIEVVK